MTTTGVPGPSGSNFSSESCITATQGKALQLRSSRPGPLPGSRKNGKTVLEPAISPTALRKAEIGALDSDRDPWRGWDPAWGVRRSGLDLGKRSGIAGWERKGVFLDTLLHLLHYVFRSRQRHRGVCRLGRLCLSLRWAVHVKLFFPDLFHRIWDYGQELTAGAFFGVRVVGEAFAPAPASRESHKHVVLRDEVMALTGACFLHFSSKCSGNR